MILSEMIMIDSQKFLITISSIDIRQRRYGKEASTYYEYYRTLKNKFVQICKICIFVFRNTCLLFAFIHVWAKSCLHVRYIM